MGNIQRKLFFILDQWLRRKCGSKKKFMNKTCHTIVLNKDKSQELTLSL